MAETAHIAFETETGAPVDVMADIKAAETGQPASTPPASTPLETPTAEPPVAPVSTPPPEEPDESAMTPKERALLADLREARATLKADKPLKENAIRLATMLKNRPDLVAQLEQPPSATRDAPTPAPPVDDTQEMTDLAQTLMLVDQQGKLDVNAARRVAHFTRTTAQQAAESAVAPVRGELLRDKALIGRAEAYRVAKDEMGLDDDIAATIIDALPQEVLSNREQLAGALIWGAGQQRLRDRAAAKGKTAPHVETAPAPAAPKTSPIYRESSGGKAPTPPTVSGVERAAMKHLGVKDEKTWASFAGKLDSIDANTRHIPFEEE